MSDDLHTLLTDAGPDAFALAYVDTLPDPISWEDAPVPAVGETGAVRAAAGHGRIDAQEVCHGRQEALRRWLQLDNAHRPLAIISADLGELREHTPGELAANLLRDPTSDDAQIPLWLSNWLYRRCVDEPQDRELGWVVATAAWACHMRALADTPTPSVLSLLRAGEMDEATEDLVITTGNNLAEAFQRLVRSYRPREELAEDWRTVEALSADVPALKVSADWLLDQVALRDSDAQQLRAALEPDVTDHLQDRLLNDVAAPALDSQRTAHLAEARETVRAYTAAAYSGRHRDAQQVLDVFVIPARALDVSGPALAWRQRSASAQQAVDALAARREAVVAEGSSLYVADPERLHAEAAYLAVREAQLHLVHDALGRVAAPVVAPPNLPEGHLEIAAGRTHRRLGEAFGSVERARQVLDGQIAYLQQSAPSHQREEALTELELLQGVRRALDPQQIGMVHDGRFDEGAIRRRVEQIRPAQADASWRPASSKERDRRIDKQSSPLPPQPGAGGIRPQRPDAYSCQTFGRRGTKSTPAVPHAVLVAAEVGPGRTRVGLAWISRCRP